MSILEVECLSNYYKIYAGSQWLYNCLSVHSLIAGKEKTPLGVPLPTVEPTNQCCGDGGGGGGRGGGGARGGGWRTSGRQGELAHLPIDLFVYISMYPPRGGLKLTLTVHT